MFVTSGPGVELETYLGSCVGVVLYDAQAKIAGMIHILLPSGSAEKEISSPSRFAASGIPLLLSEMVKRGAARQRIVAVIAGGALLLADRPLSIEMNIGRKNSEAVRQLLNNENIPIVLEETGGHKGRFFHFSLAKGLPIIRELGERQEKASTHKAGHKPTLRELQARVDRLKPLPETVHNILSRKDYYEGDPSLLEKDILKDQALTASVLKVSNSAFYGFERRISTIKRAITVIGLQQLKELILTLCFQSLYNHDLPGYFERKGHMMKHSICCASLAKTISREKKMGNDYSHVAFTAGLLHDIGKVMLSQYAFESFNLIMDRIRDEKTTFIDAEREILGFDHAQAGGMITRGWNLPEALTEAIMLHHRPEESETDPGLASTIHLSDYICSMFGEGCAVDEPSSRIHQFAISTLALQRSDVERIVESLPDVAGKSLVN